MQKARIYHGALSEYALLDNVGQTCHEEKVGWQLTIKPLVHMKSPMGEVLECVGQYHGGNVLNQGQNNPVNTFRCHQLQRRIW